MSITNEDIKKFASKLTPEYFEQIAEDNYKFDRKYPENFSNWYPHIKSFGKFRSAKVISNQIFTKEETSIMRKEDIVENVNWNQWLEILKPTLDKMESNKLYSIKNGCFSNKFEFNTCITNKVNLAKNLFEINYASSLFDTCGYTELVVREYIPYNNEKECTIYNGMPLREELRVFYNMDEKKIEYMEDYWNYEYSVEHMPNLTDKIIFMWFHNKTRRRHEQHIHEINVMKQKIKDRIDTLEFDDKLHGIWSLDFMNVAFNDKYNGIWLIDAARGFRSAYWNPARLTQETKKKLRENELNNFSER